MKRFSYGSFDTDQIIITPNRLVPVKYKITDNILKLFTFFFSSTYRYINISPTLGYWINRPSNGIQELTKKENKLNNTTWRQKIYTTKKKKSYKKVHRKQVMWLEKVSQKRISVISITQDIWTWIILYSSLLCVWRVFTYYRDWDNEPTTRGKSLVIFPH